MFTDDDLVFAAGELTFGRALSYVDRVQDLAVRDRAAAATVQGGARYTVQLSWTSRTVDGDCDCPHAESGNFCKHLVAVGLAVLDQAPLAAAPGTGCGQRAEADSDALVRLVNAAMPRGFIDYRRSFSAAKQVEAALDELEDLLDAGAGEVIRRASERATTRMRKVLLNADDSAGVLGDAGQRAAELHVRSCCQGPRLADADARKLGRWLARFRLDSPGWPVVTLEMYAPALGDPGLATYRAEVSKAATASDGDEYELSRMRLELADHDDDVDGAVAVLAGSKYGPQFAAIVNRLTVAGRPDDALAWLDRAVAADRLAAPWQNGNDTWISPASATHRYLDADRGADALAVARDAFRRHVSSQTLALVRDVASRLGVLEQENQRAMQAAEEQAARRRDGSALVMLALGEDDVVAAWAAAGRYGPGAAWKALAEASAADLPIAAADLYRPELDRLLQYADTSNYPAIVKILTTMRSLYAKVDEAPTIDALISEIREKYRRRTSLIARLDKAGLRR